MQLISPWAPNVNPMIVHFPIVLVSLAAVAALIHLVRPRARGARGHSPVVVPAWRALCRVRLCERSAGGDSRVHTGHGTRTRG